VPIDEAIATLDGQTMHGGPVIVGLQWLALNCGHLAEFPGVPR
jgi:hypothetical protein